MTPEEKEFYRKYGTFQVNLTEIGGQNDVMVVERGFLVYYQASGSLIDGTQVFGVEKWDLQLYVGMDKHVKCLEEGALRMQTRSKAEIICPIEYLTGLDPELLAKIPAGQPLILNINFRYGVQPEPFDKSLMQRDRRGQVKSSFELLYQGDGRQLRFGDDFVLSYSGKTHEGVVFENEYISELGDKRTLGTDTIKCWDEALQGIQLGSKVRIICPPGKWSRENKDSSYGQIEADSVLIYELTVNQFKPGVVSVVTDHKKMYLMKQQYRRTGLKSKVQQPK